MENQYIRLINRNHPLPPDYIPKYLVDIGLPFDATMDDPNVSGKMRRSRCP